MRTLTNLLPKELIIEFDKGLSDIEWANIMELLRSDDVAIRVIARRACVAKERKVAFDMGMDDVNRKVTRQANTRRRNTVRRIFKKNKLFALHEIREIYPDYIVDMLDDDLKTKPKKKELPKGKMKEDFRSSQLRKIKDSLKYDELDNVAYSKLCVKFAFYTSSLNSKRNIVLPVKIEGIKIEYYFKWYTEEDIIKKFHASANSEGMTHEKLGDIQKRLLDKFNPK